MGNILGRLSRQYTYDAVKERTRPNKANADDIIHVNDISSKRTPFSEDFLDVGSDVDKVTITIEDYQGIQELLGGITEKQFEKAYQQAVILLSSGMVKILNFQSP